MEHLLSVYMSTVRFDGGLGIGSFPVSIGALISPDMVCSSRGP